MWLSLASKLVPGMIKTGMSIAANRRKTKELESVAELKLAERMATGEVEFKRVLIDSSRRLERRILPHTYFDPSIAFGLVSV